MGLNLDDYKYFAGHSLGEYSALVCSRSLKFKDALYLLRERGKAMQEAVPVGNGAMLAILGSQIEEINHFISQLTEPTTKHTNIVVSFIFVSSIDFIHFILFFSFTYLF